VKPQTRKYSYSFYHSVSWHIGAWGVSCWVWNIVAFLRHAVSRLPNYSEEVIVSTLALSSASAGFSLGLLFGPGVAGHIFGRNFGPFP
jgi:hypothetical protein